MKPAYLTASLLIALSSLPAHAAGKDCNELKTDIATKMDANGVKHYELTITKSADVQPEDKVVGSCEGGTNKIVYTRKDAEKK